MNEATLDKLTRAEYSKFPARTPFSRKIVPFEQARNLGMRSWVQAQRRALATIEDRK